MRPKPFTYETAVKVQRALILAASTLKDLPIRAYLDAIRTDVQVGPVLDGIAHDDRRPLLLRCARMAEAALAFLAEAQHVAAYSEAVLRKGDRS